jgi:hypothetical protein
MQIQYKAQPDPVLWPGALDYKVKNFAHARNVVGDIIEEFTAAVTGAKRLKTDGTNPYCPDLLWHDNTLIECKASGMNGSVIVYEGRLAKDLATITRPWELYYWVWRHKAGCKVAHTYQSLQTSVIDSIISLTVLPLPVVAAVCMAHPVRQLNTAYTGRGDRLGYGNAAKGYGTGWCLPVTRWQAAAVRQTVVRLGVREITAYWSCYGDT